MEINLGHSAVTKEIYLDNAATTRVYPSVCEKMVEVMSKDYGNPSSLHMKGFTAEQYVKEARKNIASVMKADEKEIVFTSGGTESNNMAIIGSYNLDMRSTYMDTELMLAIHGEEFCKELEGHMNVFHEKCRKVLDEKSYEVPEGVTVQEIPFIKEVILRVLGVVLQPVRYLA